MEGIRNIDGREIERRKDRMRRAWHYRKVDHIPIGLFLEDLSNHTLREVCESGALQFECNWRNIDRLLRILPDDYIPTARVWPGYVTIATVFGLKVHWSDNPNQAPGVLGHIVHDLSDVYRLPRPNPATSGLMPFNLKWLRYFAANFPLEVSLTGIDLGGPMNTAKDLFDTDLLYTAFYDDPQAFHHFLDLATEVQIGCLREIISAVGDINRMTCVDFDPIWGPEGHKGFVSDDVCTSYSPDVFREFSVPYNNRIFQLWPGGRIHNCGPNPAISLYLDHNPLLNGLNCSFRHSRGDLAMIKEAFRGRGIVEFMFDFGENADDIVCGFEEIAHALAPDVIGIPVLWFDGNWKDDEILDVYECVRCIAEQYAGEMNWVGGN